MQPVHFTFSLSLALVQSLPLSLVLSSSVLRAGVGVVSLLPLESSLLSLPAACVSFSMFLLLFMLLVCASLVGRPSRLPRHRLLSVCFLRCSVARCTHIITVSVKQTTNIHKSTNLLRDQRHTHATTCITHTRPKAHAIYPHADRPTTCTNSHTHSPIAHVEAAHTLGAFDMQEEEEGLLTCWSCWDFSSSSSSLASIARRRRFSLLLWIL